MRRRFAMSRRVLILLVVASLLVGVAATGASATPGERFYIEKTCAAACVITTAEAPFEGLLGATIDYEDRVLMWPNPGGHLFETARITIVTPDGTLFGRIHFKDVAGTFTITRGTGDYQGLHVNGVITWSDLENWIFALEGSYHFERN
jgi:hypothetical protein